MEEEEDHEFYMSPMGKIFKLMPGRAPVEVDEDDVPLRLAAEPVGRAQDSNY